MGTADTMRWKIGFISLFWGLSLAFERTEEKRLQCVPSVESFSSRISSSHFYTCKEGYDHPHLERCPDEKVYHTQKQKCVTAAENKISAIDGKALGMNFQLGSLYDARGSRFYPDSSPWSSATLAEAPYEYNKYEVRTEFTADKTVKSKTVGMGIDAKFSLELLGGLITISGSAGYARSTTKTDTEVHVQMNYYTSKYTQTIPKKTPIDYPDVCNSTQYTHVVTSVTYGLQAVMDFHKKTQDDDFEGSVSGSMGWILNMIPGLATGTSHLSEEERVVADECTITIFGDFPPEDAPPPANLNQAVEFYRNLPSLTGTKEDHWKGTTIQEFHATPISDICADLNPTLNELNESLMKASESMLDDLDRLRMRVGSLLDSVVAIRFSPLEKNLQIYQKALKDFTSAQKRRLQEIIPRIRGGNAEAEEDLIMLLTDYLNSMFQLDKSLEFLINRSRELNAIRFLLESFPPAPNRLVQDYTNIEEAQAMFLRDKVVLLELGVLSDVNVTKSFLDGEPMDENDFWYNKQNTSGAVGSTVRNFFDFADANVDSEDKGYVIKLKIVSEEDPTKLTAYNAGVPIPEPFEIPLVTELDIMPFNISVNGFKFTVPKANQFVDSCQYTLTDLTTTAKIENEEKFENNEATISVNNTAPLHQFTMQYSYVTLFGSSPKSPPVKPFFTTASTEPQQLKLEQRTAHSLSFSWQPPAVVADSLIPSLSYKLQLWREGQSLVEEQRTSSLEATFLLLNPANQYTVTASAFAYAPLGPAMHRVVEGPPISIAIYTLPLPPTILPSQEVTETSVSLTWEVDSIAPGAQIDLFAIEWNKMDFNGTTLLQGTTRNMDVADTASNQVLIGDLEPSTLYAFRAKMFTNAGNSEFSRDFYVQTDFDKTALDDIYAQANASASDIFARTRLCGWRARAQGSGPITFTRVFTTDEAATGSGMDPASGLFTAGRSGIYKAVVSAKMIAYSEHEVKMWMQRGNEKINESGLISNSTMVDQRMDIASKEIAVQLDEGETLSLVMESTDEIDEVNYLTFCVSSLALE